MAIRVTQFFRWSGVGPLSYGASETHWYLPGVTALADVVAPAIFLANKRTAMLASNVETVAVRLSDDAVTGDSRMILNASQPGGDAGLRSTTPKAGTPARSDQPNACLLYRAIALNPLRRKQIYICGVPDDMIFTSPAGPNIAAVAGYEEYFATWKALLEGQLGALGGAPANTWGFRCRAGSDSTNRKPILNWTQSAGSPANLIFHVTTGTLVKGTGGGASPVVQGDVVQVRNVKMLVPGTPRPIGHWRVAKKTTVGAVDEFELRSTAGYDAEAIDDPGTVEPVTYEYAPYKEVTLTGQRTRKRGVGSLRARGRSRGRSRRLV